MCLLPPIMQYTYVQSINDCHDDHYDSYGWRASASNSVFAIRRRTRVEMYHNQEICVTTSFTIRAMMHTNSQLRIINLYNAE
jgi:hypothetical protein